MRYSNEGAIRVLKPFSSCFCIVSFLSTWPHHTEQRHTRVWTANGIRRYSSTRTLYVVKCPILHNTETLGEELKRLKHSSNSRRKCDFVFYSNVRWRWSVAAYHPEIVYHPCFCFREAKYTLWILIFALFFCILPEKKYSKITNCSIWKIILIAVHNITVGVHFRLQLLK